MTNRTNRLIRMGKHRPLANVEQLTTQRLAEINSVIRGQKLDCRMDLKDLHVYDKLRDNIKPLILKNSNSFASKDTELGNTDTVRMRIDTGIADSIK